MHTQVTEGRLTAANYEREDVITYRQAIKQYGLEAGASVVVTGVDARRNPLTAQKPDGEEVTYNPARFRAETGKASVQRDERREFAVGELVQFTASDKVLGVKTGDFGTIETIAANRAIRIRLDTGKTVELNGSTSRAIDYGYTVDGSRSFAADRLLVSVERRAETYQRQQALECDLPSRPGRRNLHLRRPLAQPHSLCSAAYAARTASAGNPHATEQRHRERSQAARPAGAHPRGGRPEGTRGRARQELRCEPGWSHRRSP